MRGFENDGRRRNDCESPSIIPKCKGRYLSMMLLFISMLAILMFTVLSISSDIVAADLTPRGAILIEGDADFTTANGVVSGSGTPLNPYVISGWNISSGTSKFPLTIKNTTKHFIIKDMFLDGYATSLTKVIVLENVGNGTLENITINITSDHDIWMKTVENITVRDFPNVTKIEFHIQFGSNVNIYDMENVYVDTTFADNCTFQRCGGTFLLAQKSRSISILECTDWGENVGLNLYLASDCTIENCTFGGASFRRSSGNRMRNVQLGKLGLTTMQQGLTVGGHDIDRSNTVNGKPIHYYYQESDKLIDYQIGQLILDECSNFTVRDITIEDTTYSIQMRFSYNCLFENVSMSARICGLLCNNGDNITLRNCTSLTEVLEALYYPGIAFYRTKNITIDRCVSRSTTGYALGLWGYYGDPHTTMAISNSSFKGWSMGAVRLLYNYNTEITFVNCTFFDSKAGMVTDSRPTSLTISNCTFVRCQTGIRFDNIENCRIYHNTFVNNSFYAFEILRCNNLSIYHNNILYSNYAQGQDPYYWSHQATSDTDAVLYEDLRGNYWHDYTQWYPNANNVSGVWDIPYPLDGSQSLTDPYPLVDPVDWLSPIAWAGEDQTVPQNTTVTLNGMGSLDNMGVVKYLWTFIHMGEEVSSAQGIYQFTFDEVGVHTINLTVWDRGGSSDSDTVVITVIDTIAPFIHTGGDISVGMGEYFTLDATASWDYIGIVGFSWTVEGNGIEWTFDEPLVEDLVINDPGIYQGTVEAIDAAGNLASATITIEVRDINAPVADAGPDQEVSMGTTVELNGSRSSDNIGIIDWNWTFVYQANTITLHGRIVSFTFMEPGIYEVTLVVSDSTGLVDQDSVIIKVKDEEPPSAWLGYDQEIDQHYTLELDGSRSSDNVGIVGWTFIIERGEDIVVLDGPIVTYTFDEAGEYQVTLNVTDAYGNWDVDTIKVMVRDITPPIARAGPDQEVEVNTIFLLDSSSSTDNIGVHSVSWNIVHPAGNTELNGAKVEHVFGDLGIHNITLVVSDRAGNQASDTMTVTVIDSTAPIVVVGEDARIESGSSFVFDGTASTDNVGILNWTWSFEYNGTIVKYHTDAFEFVFKKDGNYTITLIVTDQSGNTGTGSMVITVYGEPEPGDNPPIDNGGEILSDTQLIVIIILVILASAALVVWYVRSRRPGPQ
jgi:PKD repeat protein